MAASNPQLLTWDVTLRVVTPVHIGDNTTLRGDLADFVIREIEVMQRRERRLLVTNWESLLTAVPLDVAEQATRSPQGLRNLVSAAFEHPRDTRYSVRLFPRDTPGEMRNFIRDGMGEIYIPGSSIKGAIRTALVARAMAGRRWSLGGQYSRHPERDLRGNDAPLIATSRDARQLSAPNRDILRFLRVSDFYPRRTVPTYAGSFRVGRRADLPPGPVPRTMRPSPSGPRSCPPRPSSMGRSPSRKPRVLPRRKTASAGPTHPSTSGCGPSASGRLPSPGGPMRTVPRRHLRRRSRASPC